MDSEKNLFVTRQLLIPSSPEINLQKKKNNNKILFFLDFCLCVRERRRRLLL